jgi:hypothetical protein
MHWKKTRVSVTIWEAHGYRIVETQKLSGPPFTLEAPDHGQGPIAFDTLDTAKAHAAILNELALAQEDNARLRAELSQHRGVWPEPARVDRDDGRGIPAAFTRNGKVDLPSSDMAGENLDFGEPLEAGMPEHRQTI